jgi:hypothetical protein
MGSDDHWVQDHQQDHLQISKEEDHNMGLSNH